MQKTCGFSNRPMVDDASCTYAQQLISACNPLGPDHAFISGCSSKAKEELVGHGEIHYCLGLNGCGTGGKGP